MFFRPSSRSDSMHENYRERVNEHRYRQKDRDRERDYHRRQRDPHGYMQVSNFFIIIKSKVNNVSNVKNVFTKQSLNV